MTLADGGESLKTMPELNIELCDGCGLCVIACHGGAIIRQNEEIVIIQSENCDFCAVCEAVCPHGAIRCAYTISTRDRQK